MWQFLFFLIGFVFCSHNTTHVETDAGKDVNLQCLGLNSTDVILTITWTRSNGTILFRCNNLHPCENNNTTRHTLGRNNTFISSTVTIRNISLVHEDEYEIAMVSFSDRHTCKIRVAVNVPPKGLTLIEKPYGTILQNNGSVVVAEGENKILLCNTNTSVKPAVDLEWVFPNGLNVSTNFQEFAEDDHDKRLFVPTRTIHFTPTYAYTDYIVLICKVAGNSSFVHIQTSVFINKEGERTTDINTLETGTKKNHAMTTSNGYSQGSGTSCTPTSDPLTTATKKDTWYKTIRFVIPGCSGVVMLLIVLAFIGGFIRSKKRNERRSLNAESSEFRPPQGRRSLPPTPSDQSPLPTNHLPDQPPPTARLLRPVPSIPPDIPMRPLVPVSEDATRRPTERTVTQAQKESDTEMEYDLLNISHHGAPGAVPHVYRETANGSAEYALVSRQKVDKRIDHRQLHRFKQIDDDSDYDLLNTLNQTGHGTVPHVYKETTSGLAEYAVVSKPEDKKKRQSLGPLTKVMKAPINMEAEYAVVDKSKKRAK